MQPIIIKKKKVHGHGHHGGSWKVAFADFMTAMMAFFLLMWLIAAANDPQKRAIAGYFNDVGGALVGPGGANTGVIQFDHPQSSQEPMKPPSIQQSEPGGKNTQSNGEGISHPSPITMTEEQLREQYEKQEKENLQNLKAQLQNALNNSAVLREVRDQIIIDYTGLGLRVQIVDKEQRPMFDLGKAKIKDYSLAVLEALAPLLDSVPNHLSITGHTDATKYGDGAVYSNWELSADRANTARRALIEGGYPEDKIINVQGMGSAAPYKPEDPYAPINRRIAILVLKKSVEEALLGKTGISSEHVLESGGGVLMPEPAAPAGTAPANSEATAPKPVTP